ncbi:MAG: hypothetical protein ACLVJ6_02110 [Merdibacter sp.]
MGRCAAICKGLENGDEDLVRHACTDRMQEPTANSSSRSMMRCVRWHCQWRVCLYISGSGPTMIAIVDRSRSEALCAQLAAVSILAGALSERGRTRGVVEDE